MKSERRKDAYSARCKLGMKTFSLSNMGKQAAVSHAKSSGLVRNVAEKSTGEWSPGSNWIAKKWFYETRCTVYVLYILTYKSLPCISFPPKKRVPMWSKIIDPRISRRWFLRACTGCKLGPVLHSVEARISKSPDVSWQEWGRMVLPSPQRDWPTTAEIRTKNRRRLWTAGVTASVVDPS